MPLMVKVLVRESLLEGGVTVAWLNSSIMGFVHP